MKKVILLLGICFSAALMAQAQDTTKLLLGRKEVLIITTEGSREISINDLPDSFKKPVDTAGRTVVIEKEIEKKEGNDGESVVIINKEDENNITTPKDANTDKSIAHWSGFEMGVNALSESTQNLQMENKAYNLDYSRSLFANLNFLEEKLPFFKGYGGLVTGLGLNFNHFAFKGPTNLQFNQDSTWATQSSNKFKKNNLNATYLTMPLMFEFNTSLHHDKSFHIAFGVEGGFKILSRVKQKFSVNGTESKINNRGHYNLNPLRADAIVRVGYKSITFFANYPLTQFFQKNAAPQLYTFQVGLRILDFNK
ncbi:outer membrane beta-barrel protein [bacterium]|nr:outer membrane beta-barrel protein [bacterium]